jgi:hypothetical protein
MTESRETVLELGDRASVPHPGELDHAARERAQALDNLRHVNHLIAAGRGRPGDQFRHWVEAVTATGWVLVGGHGRDGNESRWEAYRDRHARLIGFGSAPVVPPGDAA